MKNHNDYSDEYLDRFIAAVRASKNDEELSVVLNKLYADGFEDGANEGK